MTLQICRCNIYLIIYAFLACFLSERTKKNDVLIINNIYVEYIPPMKLKGHNNVFVPMATEEKQCYYTFAD